MSATDVLTEAPTPTEIATSVASALEALATAVLATATAVADEAQNVTLPLGLDGSDVTQSTGNYVVVSVSTFERLADACVADVSSIAGSSHGWRASQQSRAGWSMRRLHAEHDHRTADRPRGVSAERVRAEPHEARPFAELGDSESPAEEGVPAATVAGRHGNLHLVSGAGLAAGSPLPATRLGCAVGSELAHL